MEDYIKCQICGGRAVSVAAGKYYCLDCQHRWQSEAAKFAPGRMYGGLYWIGGTKVPVVFLVKKISTDTMQVIGGWYTVSEDTLRLKRADGVEYVDISISGHNVTIWAYLWVRQEND